MLKPRICLSMIVKNEAPVIARCLASVLPIIDYWIICDTGSTDGTQDIIREFFAEHGKPGELLDRPWRDFAHNRTQALDLARPHGDYTLIIDADDVLALPTGFVLPGLIADSYTFDIVHVELRYQRTQLIRSALPWRYEGVLHEFLSYADPADGQRIFPENRTNEPLPGVEIHMGHDGARRRVDEAVRYARDAEVLATALATETDPFLVSRYTFYLAQSHENAGNLEQALDGYLKRAELGFWDQERYISLYRASRIKVALGHPSDQILETFSRAAAIDPTRPEALHGAARYCREKRLYQRGYEFAKRGCGLERPTGALFVEGWIYDYGLLDEFAVNAFGVGHYGACIEACRRLLDLGSSLPDAYRSRIEENSRLAQDRLHELESTENLSKSSEGSAETTQARAEDIDATSTPAVPPDPETPPQSYSPSNAPGRTLHVLGVAHTVPHEDYMVCAFTGKILAFPDIIQPFGWDVVEYSNEGSASHAREHVVILTRERLQVLSRRTTREQPMDLDVDNKPLQEEFQNLLVEKIRARARPGDIVCHVMGPNFQVSDALPHCHHIEICVGYLASPGLPFRVYESSAWMHWHYGKAGQEDGHNYKWVIPSGFNVDAWPYCEQPDDYAVYLGRVTPRKGIDTLVEIARRMPDMPIHVYGPGDTSPWQKELPPNLHFKGVVLGKERVEVVRRARCMLMPTAYIEPFGNSGIEAQLCGVPLIGTGFGAFQETIVDGVTGYRCHTLADWISAIKRSASLDREQISRSARKRYSKEEVGRQYNWVFRQVMDLSTKGWYGEISRKFEDTPTPVEPSKSRRIWLIMPYFGVVPSYFQLFLDSLARNSCLLSVIFLSDIDLSNYVVPENFVVVSTTIELERQRAADFVREHLAIVVESSDLIKQPQKFCDFRVCYLEMYKDVFSTCGATENDFVGWGDCDLVYGNISDFDPVNEAFDVIGGFHGHFTAFRNRAGFQRLFEQIPNLRDLLLADDVRAVDEIAFRQPLLDFVAENNYNIFYINRYFCDVVPPVHFHLFRPEFSTRAKNFFDVYNPEKDIDYVFCSKDGRLTVYYEDGTFRPAIYCHLQKRAMSVDLPATSSEYLIRESAFAAPPSAVNHNGDMSFSEADLRDAPAEIATYLRGRPPFKLEVGAGPNAKTGWLATDLNSGTSQSGTTIVALDVTKRFPIPDGSIDYIYSEHMIEHIGFDDGLNMLGECYRILRSGGVLRIVTPSLAFLRRITSSRRGELENRYREWSVTACMIDPPAVTDALFLNNFMRAWGHQFIYDHETLCLALRLAGFRQIEELRINESAHDSLKNLECVERLPARFLELESMIFEATKIGKEEKAAIPAQNLALGCKAEQSSISVWSRERTTEADAMRVVSGVWTNSYNNHTEFENNPWWRVDLGRRAKIFRVKIYNRRSTWSVMQRLCHFEIHVSDDNQNWRCLFQKTDDAMVHGHRLTPFTWTPPRATVARFVKIMLPSRTYLHLEQVEIYGEWILEEEGREPTVPAFSGVQLA